MAGSLHTALGLAIYMGFSRAYLVGCDYLFTPQCIGHFYNNFYSISDNYDLASPELVQLEKIIKIVLVTPKNMKSKYFNYITYKDLTGRSDSFRENIDIVDPNLYKYLKLAYQNGWISEV